MYKNTNVKKIMPDGERKVGGEFSCGSDSNGLILGTWPQAVVDAHHPTI